MFKQKGITFIELMIVLSIVGILITIFFFPENEPVQKSELHVPTNSTGRILNPDGTPVRPNNDQISYYDTKIPSVEDSVGEQCIDGIIYLFVTKNGKDFMAPKEDTFGYNVKCSD